MHLATWNPSYPALAIVAETEMASGQAVVADSAAPDVRRNLGRNRANAQDNFLLPLNANVKVFNFFSGPGSLAKKCQARFNTGIELKTPDADYAAEVLPSEVFNQFGQDHFECLSMERVVGWHK
jgi:hypothetical protein